MNKWGIPSWLEKKVGKRDKKCVYCGVNFKNNTKDRPSWEHIDNNGPSDKEWNIALCCDSCNRHKFTTKLTEWLKSDYCKEKKITKSTVAPIIKKYLSRVY